MKTLKKTMQQTSVYLMVASLVYGSITPLYAADDTTQKAAQVLNLANNALNMYGQFTVQKQQSLIQQLQAQKNQKLMQQLSPGCKKSDGTFCHIVAGKIFPECPLSASISNFPQNVCLDQSMDSSKVTEMMTYEAISSSWMNYYDHMLNKAANGVSSIGIQCLDEKKKNLDSAMTEMINNLTRLQDKLKKEREQFVANNKKVTDQMDALNAELNGKQGQNDLNAKTADYKSLFSPSCQNVIGNDINKMMGSSGLLGINQSISTVTKDATNHNTNKNAIEKEIRTDIEKLSQVISKGGLANFLDGQFTDASQYSSIQNSMKKQAQDFNIAKTRIEGELKELGYTPPKMSTNFSEDFAAFLSDSKTYFKKQYINNCTTGEDGSGIAIPAKQILSNLQQKSTGTGGTATAKYKAALENILNSDAFIQDKINKVKALESTYKDITITYQSSNGQRITETPYDLLVKTITKCEATYAQSGMYTNSGNGEVSQAKKVERAQKSLRELQGLHDNYSSNLANLALDQVLNCSGTTKKSGASCSGEAFDFTQANFCLAHASQCANEVVGCNAEVAAHIKVKQAKMETLAKVYNTNMKNMVDNANKLYDLQKVAVSNLVKTIQEKVPGTNFEIPADMFISLPEMGKDRYGVDLINDGNMNFTEELPAKIESLKLMFTKQKAATLAEVNTYIQSQESAMNTQKQRWEGLMSKCTQQITQSTRNMQRENDRRQQAQAKMDSDIGGYCQKYNALVNHPVGGCDQAKGLYETMNDVSSRLSNNAADYIANYQALCNQYNNESSSSSSLDAICDDPKKVDSSKSLQAKCNEYAASKASAGGASASAARPPKLPLICGNKDKANSDADLFASLASKFAKKDQDKIKNAKNIDELISIAEETGNYNISEFAIEASRFSKSKDNKSICAKLFEQQGTAYLKSSDSPETADKAIKEIEGKITAEENKSRTVATATPATAATTTATTPAATPAAENNNLENLKKELEDKKQIKSAVEIRDMLLALRETPPSDQEIMNQQFSRLGEQVTNDCDAQANNVGQQKGFPSFNLNSFDASVLGTSR